MLMLEYGRDTKENRITSNFPYSNTFTISVCLHNVNNYVFYLTRSQYLHQQISF